MTHRFHPLYGRDFEFVAHRQNWGEDRVHLHDENGQLFSLPAGWTHVAAADPFVVIAAGRCAFTADGLLAVADPVDRFRAQRRRPGCKEDYAVNVRRIMPLRFASRMIMAAVVAVFLLFRSGNAVTRRPACKAPASMSGRIVFTLIG